MVTTTTVNGQTVVHKDSGGVVTSTDICNTPAGSSVVPIPYVNVAKSEETANGIKTVTVDGNPIMLKDSYFSTSSGNEAGTAGGVGSGVIKAKFVNYSFDVFVEGRPVCRRLDPMVSNIGRAANTLPAPLVQPNVSVETQVDVPHTLAAAFVFEHPHVVSERVTQPHMTPPYTIDGPEKIQSNAYHCDVGILQKVSADGEYSLTFDRLDLEEKPIAP